MRASANARRNADGLGVFRRGATNSHVTRKQVSARGNPDRQYNLVSWALNSFGVPLDDFLPGAEK
jgi:hypothetical protein